MDLSIIIVNWNSKKYLRKCLKSIFENTRDVDFEVIVVDNASYDGCRDMIETEFSAVKFVQNQENCGFSKANNLGYSYSSGKNLLFLNPDTVVISTAIKVMLSSLESIPDAGAIGCRLLHSDFSLQLHSVQRYPTFLNQLLDLHFLKVRYPKWKLWGTEPLYQRGAPPQTVEVIPGACLMVRKRVFEEVGLFTEDYFMYAEDVDLCYKINQTRRKVYFVDGAEVLHHGGGSSRRAQAGSFHSIMMRESNFKFVLRTRGRVAASTYRLAILVTAVIHLLLLITVLPFTTWRGRTDGLNETVRKWKKILRWSLGLEGWARKVS